MGKILKLLILPVCIFLLPLLATGEPERFSTDTIKTSDGRLQITFLGHASLKMDFHGRNIYIDPSSEVADFSKMPKADIILFTHRAQRSF